MAKETILYLSGGMSGIENFNFPAFNAAAALLRRYNYKVVNPADNGSGKAWEFYMALDIGYLLTCSHVVVLDGWEKSVGATWEVAIAQMLGMKVMKFPYWAYEENPDYLYAEEFEVVEEKFYLSCNPPKLKAEDKAEPASSILMEAEKLVGGDRNKQYGDPREDFARTAKIWSIIFGIEVTASQVALCMIGVKMSRLMNLYKRDSAVDIAGYIKCYSCIEEDTPV